MGYFQDSAQRKSTHMGYSQDSTQRKRTHMGYFEDSAQRKSTQYSHGIFLGLSPKEEVFEQTLLLRLLLGDLNGLPRFARLPLGLPMGQFCGLHLVSGLSWRFLRFLGLFGWDPPAFCEVKTVYCNMRGRHCCPIVFLIN